MKNKNQDLDMNAAQRNLKKLIERTYKTTLSNQIRWAFGETIENITMFIIVCLL